MTAVDPGEMMTHDNHRREFVSLKGKSCQVLGGLFSHFSTLVKDESPKRRQLDNLVNERWIGQDKAEDAAMRSPHVQTTSNPMHNVIYSALTGRRYRGNLTSSNPAYFPSVSSGNSSSLTKPRLSYSLRPAGDDSKRTGSGGDSASAQAMPWSISLLPTLNFWKSG